MDVCVGRQPILNSAQNLAAYELLYRNGDGKRPSNIDGETMTAQVLVNTFLTMGVETVTGGQPAFINFTRNMLVGDFATLLPAERVVIEVLEDIPPDDEVLEACERLSGAGYRFAVDDISEVKSREPFFRFADYYKVDLFLAPESLQAQLPRLLDAPGRHFVAEKVETAEVFEQALDWGYDLFQGYFFSKPELIAGKDVPTQKLSYLRLLQRIQKPELDFGELESIVKADASLPYRLLRFINSAAFGWRRRIESIRHAMVAIGEREFRKWVSLLCLTGLGDDRPRELLVQAVVRAHLCENLAKPIGLEERRTDLFLLGLFSLFEAIVERPLAEVLADIPLSADVREALLQDSGPLAPVLAVARAQERADWDALGEPLGQLRITAGQVTEEYVAAVRRSQAVFEMV